MANIGAELSNNSPQVLEVEELCSGYGNIPMLRDVSFTLQKGEVVGVLGHNGMGKTTLMRTLVGHLPSTAGNIVLEGQNITRRPVHERAHLGFGYVPQGRDVFPALTVLENLHVGATAAGQNRDEAVEQAVAEFPVLARLLERRAGALSGGEQQILALARALCGKPSVLLLDEPTEGIQPSIVDEIEAYLLRQASAKTLTILVVEQDIAFIHTIADRVLWLQKGEIVRELQPAQLEDPEIINEFIGLEAGQ